MDHTKVPQSSDWGWTVGVLIWASLWCVLAPLICGCSATGPTRSFAAATIPTFADHYRVAASRAAIRGRESTGGQLLTIAADAMSLREFVRLVAQSADVSIVVEEELDDRTVSLDVREQAVDDVLAGVARRLGVQVTRTGDLFFLGQLRAEDKGVLVRRAVRLSADQVREAIGTLTSENGKVVVDGDGLVIVGDRVEVLRRVEELLGELDRAGSRCWVAQLYIVGLTNRAVDDLGINLSPAVDVALTFASNQDPTSVFALQAALGAILEHEQASGEVVTLASPTFLLQDGIEAHVFSGDRIPVPRRSVGESGAVTTVDFDEVEVGLDITCQVREMAGGATLRVAVDRSRIRGFVEESPLVSTDQWATTAVVRSSGVYLLGELKRGDAESTAGGRFRFGTREVDQWDLVQVWARLHAIDAGVRSSNSSDQREASPAAMSDKEKSRRQPTAGGASDVGESSGVWESEPPPLVTPGPTPIAPQLRIEPAEASSAKERSIYQTPIEEKDHVSD